MKRVAIINPTGFYVGGAITLCTQYAKLGIDSYIKDFVPKGTVKPSLLDNMFTFQDYAELESIASKYDRLIFVDLWHGSTAPADVLNDIIKLRKTFNSLELCWIYSNRTLKVLHELLPILNSNNFMFDHVFSLNNELRPYFSDDVLVIMRLNAFTPEEHPFVHLSDRDNVVFSSGRVEAFKGTTRYIGSITEQYIQDAGEFIFEHDGATFSKHVSGNGVSCPPQLLSVFDLSKHPKCVKDYFNFTNYDSLPIAGKFNIFPEYRLEDMYTRWQHHFAGICCILGTKSRYVKKSTLVGDKYVLEDSAESTRIENSAIMWNSDVEYADLEKLELGIPVLFSRRYADIIGFADDRLTYNSFSEIPVVLKRLLCYYNDAVSTQQTWYKRNIENVNAEILKQFTKDY